jgi:DNA-binding response OmpR family regulator
MALTVVLSVGLDPSLLRARNLVLQSAGYRVVSAHSVQEAVVQFEARDFDFVLLCQSIPAKERDGLTWWMRAFGTGIPVVSVAGSLHSDDVVAGVTVGSDPSALVWGIRELLVNAKSRKQRKTTTLDTQQDTQQVDAAQIKKPQRSSAAYEAQTRGTRQPFAALSRTG